MGFSLLSKVKCGVGILPSSHDCMLSDGLHNWGHSILPIFGILSPGNNGDFEWSLGVFFFFKKISLHRIHRNSLHAYQIIFPFTDIKSRKDRK